MFAFVFFTFTCYEMKQNIAYESGCSSVFDERCKTWICNCKYDRSTIVVSSNNKKTVESHDILPPRNWCMKEKYKPIMLLVTIDLSK